MLSMIHGIMVESCCDHLIYPGLLDAGEEAIM